MKIKSTTTQLVASVALIVCLSLAGLITYVSNRNFDMALEMGRQTMNQASMLAVQSMDDHVLDSMKMARGLAHSSIIVDAVDMGLGGSAGREIEFFLKEYSDIWAITAYDSDGLVVAGVTRDGTDLGDKDRSGAMDVQAVLKSGRTYLSSTVTPSEFGSVRSFVVSAPVLNSSGDLVGGVSMELDFDLFAEEYIAPVAVGKTGYAYVLDGNGIVIFHKSKETQGKDVSSFPFIQAALQQKNGQINYEWKGDTKEMAFGTSPQTGWIVCAATSESDLGSTAHELRTALVVSGIVLAIVLVGLIIVITGKLVVRPTERIIGFTQQIAGGNLNTALEGTFRFEFEELANNLQIMVAELKSKLGFSQSVLNSMTIPCVISDPEGRILFINQPSLDLLGCARSVEDFTGTDVSAFFYGEKRESLVGQAIASRSSLRGREVSLPMQDGSGRLVQASVDASPLYDLDGELLGGISLITDLTTVREQQQKITEQNQRIAQAAVSADEVANQLGGSAEDLEGVLQLAAQGSEAQSQRTAEASVAMEEMNASVLSVASNAGHASGLAEETKAKAAEGAGVVGEMTELISTISQQAEALMADMGELGQQASGIGDIMGVIRDIADQTNLLALNAAIEAARAGDAGRGFAVVADEVRKLAEKTMLATNDVGNNISSIQSAAAKNIETTKQTAELIVSGNEKARVSGEALREIVEMADQTADQVRGIATAAEQQSASSEQINRSSDEINRIAMENAEAMSRSIEAIAQLTRLSAELKAITGTMKSEG